MLSVVLYSLLSLLFSVCADVVLLNLSIDEMIPGKQRQNRTATFNNLKYLIEFHWIFDIWKSNWIQRHARIHPRSIHVHCTLYSVHSPGWVSPASGTLWSRAFEQKLFKCEALKICATLRLCRVLIWFLASCLEYSMWKSFKYIHMNVIIELLFPIKMCAAACEWQHI